MLFLIILSIDENVFICYSIYIKSTMKGGKNMDAFIWLALMVVFIIVEAACPLHLVSVWFAVGSLVAALVGLMHGPVWLQVVLFLVVSVGLLALLFPLVRKYITPKVEKTNVDAIIGQQGCVTADIDNVSAAGQVKLGGMEWTARSSDGNPIPAGTLVKVDKIEGVKAFVSTVKAEETVQV